MPTPNITGAYDFREYGSQTGRGSPQRYAYLAGNFVFKVSDFVGGVPVATIGVAVAWDPLTNPQNRTPLRLYEGGVAGTKHVYLFTDNTTRELVAYRGDNVELGRSTGFSFAAGLTGYQHIEAVVTISNTVGVVHVKVNGVEWMNLTGLDTRNGGTTGLIDAGFVDDSGAGSGRVTDLILTDGSGFVGDKATAYVVPNAAGTNTAGTAVGAGTLLGCIQDAVSDDDTTYVKLIATGLTRKISFNAVLPTCTAVLAVIGKVKRRKNDAGVNAGRLLIISGATEDDGGADVASPTTYTDLARVRQDDPANPGNQFASAATIEIGMSRTV